MALRVGLDCKLFRNTGTYGTPVWNEVTLVVDASLDLSKGKSEVKYRGLRWKQSVPTMKEAPVTFNMLADPAVDDYNALRDAFLNDTVVDFAMADGAIATTGTQYFRADFHIYGFKRGEPLENHATVDVEADLAYSSNPPGFTTVP